MVVEYAALFWYLRSQSRCLAAHVVSLFWSRLRGTRSAWLAWFATAMCQWVSRILPQSWYALVLRVWHDVHVFYRFGVKFPVKLLAIRSCCTLICIVFRNAFGCWCSYANGYSVGMHAIVRTVLESLYCTMPLVIEPNCVWWRTSHSICWFSCICNWICREVW